MLAYASTNPARDGRYRRISVKTKRPGLKVEYRAGYYAGRDFSHSSREDREAQLEDQLLSDLSATDLSAYLSAAAFRLSDKRSYVSLSIVVPGYQIPVTAKTDSGKASLDVLGVVEDKQKRPVGQIRDTVHLASDGLADLKRKIVQYETGLELSPGTYRVKVVVRENVLGTYGSYESDVQVPDLKAKSTQAELRRRRHAAYRRERTRTTRVRWRRTARSSCPTSRTSCRPVSICTSTTRSTNLAAARIP